jgi:mRNA interferase MazF
VDARLKRGEIWTASGGAGYVGKPRPCVIVQDERLGITTSVTVCGLTSDPTDAPIFRIAIKPNERNGLKAPSHIMADKITTISASKLGYRIGQLDAADIARLDRALLLHLGLVG